MLVTVKSASPELEADYTQRVAEWAESRSGFALLRARNVEIALAQAGYSRQDLEDLHAAGVEAGEITKLTRIAT